MNSINLKDADIAVLCHVSVFSKYLGEVITTTRDNPDVSLWWGCSGTKSSGHIARMVIGPKLKVNFTPYSDKDWEKILPLIGHCAYHKIDWTVP